MTVRLRLWPLVVLLCLLLPGGLGPLAGTGPSPTATATGTQSARASVSDTAPTATTRSLGSTPLRATPLSFEPNVGQSARQVSYLAHGPGYTLFLTSSAAVLAIVQPQPSAVHGLPLYNANSVAPFSAHTVRMHATETVLRLHYVGASATPQIVGLDPLPGRTTYFVGAAPQGWQANLPTYAKVAYHNVYPGVDLVYDGTHGRLEYDWQVRPGAEPRAIHLAVDGVQGLRLDAHGNLLLHTATGTIEQHAPLAYQNGHRRGQRQIIPTRYVLSGSHQVSFAVGAYDVQRPLIIDPVLSYSTYLGGGGTDGSEGIAVDGTGSAYVTGNTASATFPTTTGAFSVTNQGIDAFVTKLTPGGTALIYSTFIGGSTADYGYSIAVDAAHDAYVTGYTNSTDFPTVNAAQARNGGSGHYDAFVAELNATGSALLYSTYLGGSNDEYGHGITVDGAGNAYVTGDTASGNFPTTAGALQPSFAGGGWDGFVVKLPPGGGSLTYSTYLGTAADDYGHGIAVDAAGDAYVTADTFSSTFPTTAGAAQTHSGGGYDAYVAKLNPSGSALVYSTYLGGSGTDDGMAIVVDGLGNAYVVGDTTGNFPVSGGVQQTFGGGTWDAFVTKLNASGSAVVYSTYLGGSNDEHGYGIALDGASNAYVTGETASSNFPTTAGALQPGFAGGGWDAFVVKLSASGSTWGWSTYLGGSGSDGANGIALDGSGDAYVAGETASSNFPLSNALQGTNGGNTDAFVSRLGSVVSGAIPWHPHHSTRLGDHLSASVDLADGHVDVNVSSLSVPARGPALAVQHVWDSTDAQGGVTTTAGQGWLSDLTPSVGGVVTGTVVYTDATGAAWPFVFSGPTTATAPYTAYQTPPGLPWQLVTSSAGYTLTNVLNSDVLAFDNQGRYLSQTDAYANSNTLSYGPSGPINEANSGGRTLALTYTNGLLSEAASPLWQASGGTQGQHVTYGYNGTQLTTQTLGAGTTDALTSTFGYSGTQLVSVTTPYTQAVRTWTINYDAYGRVSSIVSPISGTLPTQAGYTPAITTTFTYASGQTQVIEGAGSSAPLTTTYTLDGQGEPITITDGLGDATGYSYDADHDVLSTTDANGHTTTSYYQYVGATGPSGLGSTGLVTETVRPSIAAYAPGGVLYPVTTTNVYSPSTYDLLQSSDSEGRLTAYTYDGHHGVLTTTDRLCSNAGSQTTCGAYTPPSAPPRLRPFRPFGQSVTYLRRGTISSYDPYGERVTTIDGRGVYVPSDGVALPGDPQTVISSTHSYTYTAQGDLAAEWTPPLVTTLGGVTSTAPVTTSYGYDADGNQVSLTSANNFGTGTATTYGYDHLGRAITTTLPPVPLYTGITATPVMTTGYDGEGNVVQEIDGNGDVTTSSYDPLGRLVATTNPVHGTTLYTYTATEKTAAQDPQGNITSYAYDPAGRLVLISDPLTDTVQTQYDAVGNPLTITTGTPTTTTQVETRQYDPLNEVMTDTISAPGSPAQTTHTYYDTAGRPFQVQQPSGDVTLNSYYFTGELYQQQLYPGAVAAMSGPTYTWMNYDGAGNLIERIDADGRDTLLSVDGDDRVVQQVAGPLGSTPTLTTSTGYDPDGTTVSQVVTTTSPIAATRSYTAAVNAADWTSSSGDQPTAGTPPLVTAYSYDAAGQQRGQTILNSSPPVTRTLDAEGRTTALGEGLNTSSPYTTTYSYNPNDLPLTATLPNGVQEGLGYDQDSRLITTTAIGPTGVVTPLNNSYSYAYNPSSWTTAITTMVGGITATNVITRDAMGRMVAGNASGRAQSWSYDGNGNLLGTNTTTYSYTAAITPNEVLTTTSSAGVTTTYGYDQNGDTTGISSTAGVSTNLSYDSQARLDAVKLADGTLVLMTYNAQGQRVGYSVSKGGLTSESEQVTYRGDELAQAVISNTQRYTDTYLYDPTGAPLELLRQTKSGSSLSTARYWYVLNGHGDVVALTDVSGTVVDSYSYDLWGKLGSAVEAVPQRLRYAGYWYDVELGWYWVAVRSYNPTLMRWLQPDPSQQDGVRTYVYVGDDPVDGTDPSGMASNQCHTSQNPCRSSRAKPTAAQQTAVYVVPAAGAPAVALGVGRVLAVGGPWAVVAVGAVVVFGLVVGGLSYDDTYTGPSPVAYCNVASGQISATCPTPDSQTVGIVYTPPVQPIAFAKKGKQKAENYITLQVKAQSQATGQDPCTILAAMMKATTDKKVKQDIKQAQKFMGCRHHG